MVVIAGVCIGRYSKWRFRWPGDLDFWLLVVTVASQVSFTMVARFLVPSVANRFLQQPPHSVSELATLKSVGGGASTTMRVENANSEIKTMVDRLLWGP
jgi:hypothetical protein